MVTTANTVNDVSISRLLDQLLLMREPQLLSTIEVFRETDIKAIIELLDKVSHIDQSCSLKLKLSQQLEGMSDLDALSRCRPRLKLLRRLCAHTQIHPKAMVLSPKKLHILSQDAEAFDGTYRVYRGLYDKVDIAIKVIATTRESQCDPSAVKV